MYQALYRKYRPKDFDSVVGQDAIVKTLKNSIVNNTFSHAYMFSGPRGTGKTTVSKIFARNINCLNNNKGLACEKCDNCKASFSKDCVDILEIDAASNNGVDEIRELKNKISLVPSNLKYKIYIIDEVHMLSDGAFNALLKTLEEPPEHAVFILATTDPQKVPETVKSRCQCFSFKRISPTIIQKKLKDICKKEKVNIDDEVIESIALLSEGGLRDALGILDKLISYTSTKITMKDFSEINGVVLEKELKDFLTSIFEGNIKEVLIKIDEFETSGKNLLQIVNQLLNYSRKYLVNYYLNSEDYGFSIDNLQSFTNLLNEKMLDIRKSNNSKIFLEMLILSFINGSILTKTHNKTTNVVENEKSIEIDVKQLKKEVKKAKSIKEKIIKNINEISQVRINNVFAQADKKLKEIEEKNFEKLSDYSFDQKIGYLVCNLLDSKIRVVSPELILLSLEYDSAVKKNNLIIEKLINTYNKITNSEKKLVFITEKEWEVLKKDYIEKKKENYKYEVQKEPEPIFEEINKNDIILNDALDLFGSIVEVEN